MRAIVLRDAGADTVELAEVPLPEIGDDELLVRVKAIGVGIHDSYFLPPDISYPFAIGIEAAGVVEQVGAGVRDRQPGERIAFVSSMQRKGGTWAEFAAVNAGSLIVPIPADMDFVQAAAVPVAANTVLRALTVLADVPSGASVFIAGASGAIGTLAIQVARRRGWRVCASASESNHDYMRSLGAEMAVDYRDQTWPDQVRRWANGGVDAAIAIQRDTALASLSVVRDGGRLVMISGGALTADRGVLVETVPHQADVHDELLQLMEDIARQDVRMEIERVYPFEAAPDALAKVRTRHARGKVVVQL